jgi:IS5 family transposase
MSYRELEFHLQDSAAFRAFVGLGFKDRPSHQCLQSNVKQIRPETWEALHRVLIRFAQETGIEQGHTIRGDTTVGDAAIHEPSTSLLWTVCGRVANLASNGEASTSMSGYSITRRAKPGAYTIKFHRRREDMVAQYATDPGGHGP